MISPLSRQPMRHLSAFTLAVSMLLVAGGVTATTAHAAYAPTTRAIVNNPYGATSKDAIFTELKNLLNNANAGSIARIAIFELTNRGLWDAMNAARNRGVRVRIVHGDYTSGNWTNPHGFPPRSSANADASWEVSCTPSGASAYSACVGGPGAIMHNKFATFTSVAGVKDITVISSQNWTSSAYWENAVVVTQNAGLRGKFGQFFEDLALKHRNADYYSSTAGAPASYDADGTTADSYYGKYRTYFFPKASGTANPVLNMLGTVDCTATGLPTGLGHNGRTLVRVAMNTFTRSDIASKLAAMDAQGCVVQVIYHVTTSNHTVVGALRGTSVQRWWKNTCASGGPKSVHSKYFAVSGRISGVNNRVVYTGSLNFTTPALYANDESLLRVDDDTIYNVFHSNFSDIAHAGAGTADTADDWKTGTEPAC